MNQLMQDKVRALNKINLNDKPNMDKNFKNVFHQLVCAFDKLNEIYIENEVLNKSVRILKKDKEDNAKHMHNLRLNFKQLRRNLIEKAKQDEQEKHQKEKYSMLKFFKQETQSILHQFTEQRLEIFRRTSSIDSLSRFMIHQEFYITAIGRLVSENFRFGYLRRTDRGLNPHVDTFLAEDARHRRKGYLKARQKLQYKSSCLESTPVFEENEFYVDDKVKKMKLQQKGNLETNLKCVFL